MGTDQPLDSAEAPKLDFEAQFTIFVGSSSEDVSYAKTFWNSLALHPPIESRLESADVSQRLKVAKDPSCKTVPRPSTPKNHALFDKVSQQKVEEDRQRYKDMAKRRDEIIMLLKKQREERMKRELISRPFKPKQCQEENRETSAPAPAPGPETLSPDQEEEIQNVRSLQ
ncbi:cilia- and flagella-associated protein HOATZ [Engraulis encrasicolus]|uniref:cilia- and flagella-associated protein HOATZ n=1 Tax=Engraulis encrasicolus TaxID=184585 RepID=UPI002FCF1715